MSDSAPVLGATSLPLGVFVAGLPAALPVGDGVQAIRDGFALGAASLDVPFAVRGGESAAERFLDDVQPEECTILAGLGGPADPGRGVDLSPARLEQGLTRAIRRLGRVDAIWLRGTDADTPLEASLSVLVQALEAQRLRGYGLSGIGVRELEAALSAADATGLPRPAFVRNRMNLLERGDERDLLPLAAGEGLAIVPVAPFAGGRLSDEHIAEEVAANEADSGLPRRDADPDLPLLLALRAAARDLDLPVQAAAAAWLLAHPGVTAPVFAVRTRADWEPVQLAIEAALDEESFQRLGSAARST